VAILCICSGSVFTRPASWYR